MAGDYDLEVVATEDKYLEVLELNLERVEQEEEYELCIRIRDKIKELKS
jgi:protein-arginine kinase activator protein McsA